MECEKEEVGKEVPLRGANTRRGSAPWNGCSRQRGKERFLKNWEVTYTKIK